MKISDFLYKLRHRQELDAVQENELKKQLTDHPFLADLDTHRVITTRELYDLDSKLTTLSHQEYVSDLESPFVLQPQELVAPIDTHVPISLEIGKQPSETPAAETQTSDPVSTVDADPAEDTSVYTHSGTESRNNELSTDSSYLPGYQKSDFLVFLENLPPCRSINKGQPLNPEPLRKKENLAEDPSTKTVDQPGQAHTNQIIESSLELPENLASESLANLWAIQGKHELAILMYERLGLKYPEKSATFATKIEKLKAENSL
jgi:hypothetical protein